MSDQSAIRLLQTAIENVRDQCTGDEYKSLLAAVDAADSAAEKALNEPDDSAEDRKVENQPKDLKGASRLARREFARSRGDSDSSK